MNPIQALFATGQATKNPVFAGVLGYGEGSESAPVVWGCGVFVGAAAHLNPNAATSNGSALAPLAPLPKSHVWASVQ